ncbi:hypothetical protein [Actinomadura yumaensis]|uniref:Uncharacterized protein n=2 Tax=Actinomadura TaxID=1988 RepID=A0ABW2CBJ3_9ACTN
MAMEHETSDIVGSALLEAFAQRGLQAALPEPGTVSVVLPDGSQARADIRGWRDHAERGPRSELARVAGEYADQAVAAFGRHAAAPAQAGGGAANLRVRLYPEAAFDEEMRAALVTRRLAPGLLQTVVVDHPDSIMPLNRADLGGTSEEEVFGAALTRSIEDEPHHVTAEAADEVRLVTIGERHRYVGAHVQVLARYVDGPLPYGALVSFPLPEYVVTHSIGGGNSVFTAIATLQDVTAKLAAAGEKPISSQVYWWRPGAYERMPEKEALYSGRVPDLAPVGVVFDDTGQSVSPLTAESDELIRAWLNDHQG